MVLYGNDLNVKQSHLFPETEPVGNVTAATADVVDHNGINFRCAASRQRDWNAGRWVLVPLIASSA